MEQPSFALWEHPQILELLEALEQNGLQKEREEVSSLAEYIGTMEDTLARMLDELQQMRGEMEKLKDQGLSARCSRLADTAQEKVTQVKTMVSAVRDNFLRAAKNAVSAFREKGKSALSQAVRAMQIPALLEKLKAAFQRSSQAMEDVAAQVDGKREQLHEAAGLLQNAGRVLSGREAREAEPLDGDKGILAKVRAGFSGMGRAFSNLAERTGALAGRLEAEPVETNGRRSVRTELHALKARQGGKRLIAPAREQERG